MTNRPERSTAAQVWLRTFAGATLRACNDAQVYPAQIDDLLEHWRTALGSIRRDQPWTSSSTSSPRSPLDRRISRSSDRPIRCRRRLRGHPSRPSRDTRPAQHLQTSLPHLRSARSARALHVPGASTRQPNGRHRDRASRPTGARTLILAYSRP